MKFTMIVRNQGETKTWEEDYDQATCVTKMAVRNYCEGLIEFFNSTTNPNEKPRELVEVIYPEDDKDIPKNYIDDLIEALQIYAKYENPYSPTHCEHDVLYLADLSNVDAEDHKRLEELGFFYDKDTESYCSFKFGSA